MGGVPPVFPWRPQDSISWKVRRALWFLPPGRVPCLPYPDKELTYLGIDEGDTVCLLSDGTLHKL